MSSLDTLADRLGRRLTRLPLRRKLNVLIAVPLALICLLISVYAYGEVAQATSAWRQAHQLRAGLQVAELVNDVQREQGQALLYFESYFDEPYAKTRVHPDETAYLAAQSDTDAQVERVRQSFGRFIPDAESAALDNMSVLQTPRAAVADGKLPPSEIDSAYGPLSEALIDGLGLSAPQQTAEASGLEQQLDALLRTEVAHASFETAVLSAETGDANAMLEFDDAVGSLQLYQFELQRYTAIAPAADSSRLAEIGFNQYQVELTDALQGLALSTNELIIPTNDVKRRQIAHQSALDLQPAVDSESTVRLAIAQQLITGIADQSNAASVQSWWRAGLLLGAAVVLLLLWVGVLALIRRSILRPLRRVTQAARRVSELSAAELARVADEDTPVGIDGPPRLEDLPILADDEIGELAKAFNQVQRTAGDLLERQAMSRHNTAEMFGNIGRRVANLTGRQLALIDSVERGETDPELLDQLYRIDHIAVRLQRNADSLMLLAGIRDTELDGRPAELTHVVRAALGQIEGFERVRLTADVDATVAPDVVNDLVLMLAELLENAVSFSPAHSEVQVSVREHAGQAVLEIVDHGLGMSSERLAEENARLVRRERLDLAPTRVLGLFVVGALARRWGIQVTLARTPGGGVTSRVAIPADWVSPSLPRSGRSWSPSAPQPVPAVPAAVPAAVTAAVAAAFPAATPAARAVSATPVRAALPTRSPGATGGPREPEFETGADFFTPRGAGSGSRSGFDEPAHQGRGERETGAQETGAPTADSRLPRRRRTGPDEDALSRPVVDTRPTPTPKPTPTAAATDTQASPDERPGALKRRVRGATLRENLVGAERIAVRPPDPDEVRSSLEEFEDAVSRAERDSATPTTLASAVASLRERQRSTSNPKETEGVGQ
ncbi:HAMP domain-containing sensor histidine kinase [Streptacidiphilus fuscans]|uniref:histidine kinase n=1 Tax=Streptacidiphilus fuscans TaxID=2789292 RepID=A0A931B4C3_9ACTN|nr:ATP-binding protein [Streptacidiphilus fuscans]MBF9068457.1 sensor histidine kinase [Streptacidiphilus fuscans]